VRETDHQRGDHDHDSDPDHDPDRDRDSDHNPARDRDPSIVSRSNRIIATTLSLLH